MRLDGTDFITTLPALDVSAGPVNQGKGASLDAGAPLMFATADAASQPVVPTGVDIGFIDFEFPPMDVQEGDAGRDTAPEHIARIKPDKK